IRESPAVMKARRRKFWLNRRPKHLLTGLVGCGCCGGHLAPAGKDYLASSAARRQGTCGNKKGLRRPHLERTVMDALNANLMAPDLVEEFIREFHSETNRRRQELELAGAASKRELDDVKRKLATLIDAITEGLRAPGLQEKLDQLEARRLTLEKTVSSTPGPLPRLHPNLAQLYRMKVEKLQQAIADPATHTEALEILRGLIERVAVRPVGNGFEIELVGEIARMVELGAGSTKTRAAHGEAALFESSVKVVAGERNQRYLHIVAARIPRVAR